LFDLFHRCFVFKSTRGPRLLTISVELPPSGYFFFSSHFCFPPLPPMDLRPPLFSLSALTSAPGPIPGLWTRCARWKTKKQTTRGCLALRIDNPPTAAASPAARHSAKEAVVLYCSSDKKNANKKKKRTGRPTLGAPKKTLACGLVATNYRFPFPSPSGYSRITPLSYTLVMNNLRKLLARRTRAMGSPQVEAACRVIAKRQSPAGRPVSLGPCTGTAPARGLETPRDIAIHRPAVVGPETNQKA